LDYNSSSLDLNSSDFSNIRQSEILKIQEELNLNDPGDIPNLKNKESSEIEMFRAMDSEEEEENECGLLNIEND
jgi:hypothetical protein